MLVAALIFRNEFRLLLADPVGLFMLLLAPIVIITVAGLSLANLYGARPEPHAYFVPIIDEDHGAVGTAVIDALTRDPTVLVGRFSDRTAVRREISRHARTPLAIVIPDGASERFKTGEAVQLDLYVDPVKRLEVGAIELRLEQLSAELDTLAMQAARQHIAEQTTALQARLDHEREAIRQQLAALQHQVSRSRRAVRRELVERERQARQETQTAVARALAQAQAASEQALTQRRDAIEAVSHYLAELRTSQGAFNQWMGQLRAAAGKHAAEIPPPPQWPTPPSPAALAELAKPLQLPLAQVPTIPDPAIAPLTGLSDLADLSQLAFPTPQPLPVATLPGTLRWHERSFTGGPTTVNAFDQYVPGFGITFLLIGMLMGLSMGLIDDRDWGTLQRLQISGAPLIAILLGKVGARMTIGFVQLVILLAAGSWLFGIALGEHPWALLMPASAIAFAAAAFGLIVPCLARTHDSVMPVGAVASMAMSAIGGCWWPLDFEPAWMRQLALWMPTTWTMQAFNDLMIRHLPPAEVLTATACTVGLGAMYLAIGLVGVTRIYRMSGKYC
jgi:ABC-type multidrug transport system permease subunit